MPQLRPTIRLPHELVQHCQLLPSRHTILWYLPKSKVIAEIGVGLGDWSAELITYCTPRQFIAIDRFDLHEKPEFWGQPPEDHFGDKSHLEFLRARLTPLIGDAKLSLLAGDSSAVIGTLEDRSVDIFYVDGDHTYDGVWRDLSAIRPKVADDGMIIMNDYIMQDDNGAEYGVVQATNEFMVSDRWEMIFFCLQPSMYCDVALRRFDPNAAD